MPADSGRTIVCHANLSRVILAWSRSIQRRRPTHCIDDETLNDQVHHPLPYSESWMPISIPEISDRARVEQISTTDSNASVGLDFSCSFTWKWYSKMVPSLNCRGSDDSLTAVCQSINHSLNHNSSTCDSTDSRTRSTHTTIETQYNQCSPIRFFVFIRWRNRNAKENDTSVSFLYLIQFYNYFLCAVIRRQTPQNADSKIALSLHWLGKAAMLLPSSMMSTGKLPLPTTVVDVQEAIPGGKDLEAQQGQSA